MNGTLDEHGLKMIHLYIVSLFSDTTSTNIAEEKNTFALSVLRR